MSCKRHQRECGNLLKSKFDVNVGVCNQRKRKKRLLRNARSELQEYDMEAWLEKTKRFPENRWKIEHKRSLKNWFNQIDTDRSGDISIEELAEPLLSTGLAKSMFEVSNIVRKVDFDGSSGIDFNEFLVVMKRDSKENNIENRSFGQKQSNKSRWSTVLKNEKILDYKNRNNQKETRHENPMAEFTRKKCSDHLDLKSVLSGERRKLLLDATMRQFLQREQAHEQISKWRNELKQIEGASKFKKLNDISQLIQRLESDKVEKDLVVEAMRELLKPKKVDNNKRRQRTASHQARVKQRNVSLLRWERHRQGTFRKAVVYPRTRNPSLSSILVDYKVTVPKQRGSKIPLSSEVQSPD
ncbi:hypothetical protein CTEN210_07769 [Chaetoceros tenuissimus]|uniref:EF-hand domain-containing protein n=1 Tax=Chaetoceros tenuissimus TaxID=426638 RepID=A0AAD3CSB6_9STRA|nr:hypothetical protein CTEN210_07769 [Chaetoceros tenuissimus]